MFDLALTEFEMALQLRQQSGDAEQIRVAYWMVAWTLRAQNKIDQALAIQLRLESQAAADGKPDPFVFEELELLFRAKGDRDRAQHYAGLRNKV
jgi:hypothetical protein